MTEPQTPDWVRDAVFYQIFPDRFAKSLSVPKPSRLDAWGDPPTNHGYQGGDLIGVLEHLDYLADLGVNAIYFTPIFQSASNHRYHTHDYEKVDPMLGGNEALRRLLEGAHAKGFRIVLDGVFNHASRGFFQFHDILENGRDSAYLDWFHVENFPLYAYDPDKSPNYGAWWGLPALPKFRTETPAVREFLWGIARKWIDFGIDGWRLDVPQEINDDDFWREFRHRVKEGNSEAYIVGEIWHEAPRWLQGDQYDAVMNYLFTKACIGFFIGDQADPEQLRPSPLRDSGTQGAEEFARMIEHLQALYHPNITAVLLNLLGSHDTARFVSVARGDLSALRLATLFQMTYSGAPSIYYGDEIGMAGGYEPASRGAFPWHEESSWNRELLHDIQRWIALRHARPSLRWGSFKTLLAKGNVYVFLRQLDDESTIVALNTSRQTERMNVPVLGQLAEETVLLEQWSQDSLKVEGGALRDVQLAPRSGRIFATPLTKL